MQMHPLSQYFPIDKDDGSQTMIPGHFYHNPKGYDPDQRRGVGKFSTVLFIFYMGYSQSC